MNLANFLDDLYLRFIKIVLRFYLLGFIVLVIDVGLINVEGVCPTVCSEPLDFCWVEKRMNAPPIIVDSFKDEDTPYGIVAKGLTEGPPPMVKDPGKELEAIFSADPNKVKEINVGELLDELQKEGNIYLGEDYGIGPRITLEQAIYLSLRDNEGVGFGNNQVNEGITTAYLNREIDKESLKVSVNEFRPQWNTVMTADYADHHFRNAPHEITVTMPVPGLQTIQKLKTGGSIGMTWTNSYIYNKVSGRPSDTTATTTLGLTLTQPLLKGAGFTIGTFPLTQAYLNEESSINTLKSTVITVVTQTIQSYYDYKQAIGQFEIDKRSIEESRKDLEKTKLLVSAGIRAEADIVEGQYSLAQREFSFQDARNRVDQARIAFLRVLNMDTSLNIVPNDLEDIDIDPKDLPSVEELVAVSYLNSPDYLNQLISLRLSELNYIIAQNGVLWDLTFNAGINTTVSRSSLGRSNQNAWDFRDRTVNAGLTLTIPFNSLVSEQTLIDNKINLRIAKINLAKFEQDRTSAIRNQLRDIKKNIIQLKLAKVNVMLAKQRLVQKRIEIEAGISSSFELTSVLDQFIQTETDELNARIALVRSLTDMDALIGTTLDTWHIDINHRTENLPKLSATLLGKLIAVDEDEETKIQKTK